MNQTCKAENGFWPAHDQAMVPKHPMPNCFSGGVRAKDRVWVLRRVSMMVLGPNCLYGVGSGFTQKTACRGQEGEEKQNNISKPSRTAT